MLPFICICTEMASVTALVLRGIGQTFCKLTCDGTCPMSIFQVGIYLLLLLTSIILGYKCFLCSQQVRAPSKETLENYKILLSSSRSGGPLRNINISNGNGSFTFYVDFVFPL